MERGEIKKLLRRSAAHLQGRDTSYFSRPNDLEAIRILYRLADEFSQTSPAERRAALDRMTQEAVEAGLYDKVLLPENEGRD